MTPTDKAAREAAEKYAEGCDNESGGFLSHQLKAIREKAYIAGATWAEAMHGEELRDKTKEADFWHNNCADLGKQLAAEKEKSKSLAAALGWYADRANHEAGFSHDGCATNVNHDAGERARNVLVKYQESGKQEKEDK